MPYDLELDKIVREIKKNKAKNICVQLPSGLRPRVEEIVNYIKEKTKANVFIWAGSCYGSCDIPNIKNIDLLIHFGHSKWKS